MSYSTIDALFRHYDGALNAAEAHGIAAGILCIDSHASKIAWLDEIIRATDDLDDEARRLLSELFERTRKMLQTDDCAFELLLPDDGKPLETQAEALRDWCQGFLFGVGSAHAHGDWPSACEEILRDIAEISRLDSAAEGEEDETALTEVHEYLRAAVLLFRQEFCGAAIKGTRH